MARYRKIDVRTWVDSKFCDLSPIPPCGQGLWLYLLTNPDTVNIPGLYRAGEMQLAEALGWPLEGFREAFAEAFAKGMVKADWKARVVWIPRAVIHNPPESPNVVKSWGKLWDEIPECELKTEAYHTLKAFTEGLSKAFAEAFAKGLPNQEQEQEQEYNTLSTRARKPVDNFKSTIPADFEPDWQLVNTRLHMAGKLPNNKLSQEIVSPALIQTFIAHHTSSGRTSKNWSEEFAKWCIREKPQGANSGNQRQKNAAQTHHETMARIAATGKI